MHITEKRTKTIIDYLVENNDASWAEEYGEPGYSQPEKDIVFCNWNNVSPKIADYLEEAGFEIEWADEWLISCETGKAYRSTPDCYNWKPYYIETEYGDIIGGDEIETDQDIAEEYINETLLNNPDAVNLFAINDRLEEMGFRKYNDYPYQNGWHAGMRDDPKKIAKELEENNLDYVFTNFRNSQFYVEFDAFVKPKEGN